MHVFTVQIFSSVGSPWWWMLFAVCVCSTCVEHCETASLPCTVSLICLRRSASSSLIRMKSSSRSTRYIADTRLYCILDGRFLKSFLLLLLLLLLLSQRFFPAVEVHWLDVTDQIRFRLWVSNIDGHRHLQSAGRGQLDVLWVRLLTYGGRAFCYVGPSAWNALPEKETMHFLCLPLDASLNIFTSHFTSTPSAFEVILQ